MNSQESLLIPETIYDALGADVTALGGIKKVAKPILWPAKDESTAQNRLRAALNPNHDQQLAPEEVETIVEAAAKVKSFNTARYLSRKARGEFVRVEPRTRVELLMEKVERMQSSFSQTCAELQTAVADLREAEQAERGRR